MRHLGPACLLVATLGAACGGGADDDAPTTASSTSFTGTSHSGGGSGHGGAANGGGASGGAGATLPIGGAGGVGGGGMGIPSCSYPQNAPGTGSLFVHYVGVPKPELIQALSGKGESVFVTRSVIPCGAEDATFKAWRDAGGRWAYKLSVVDEAPKVLAGDAVAWFQAKIDAGYDYVALDELRTKSDAGYTDGSPEGKALIALLNALPAPYAGRFLAYFSSGAVGELGTSYPTLAKAVAEKGRALLFERYLTSSSGHSMTTIRDTFFEPDCKKAKALGLGVAEKTLLVIGIDNYDPKGAGNYIFLDQPKTDLAKDASGMLYREFAALHSGACTSSTPGVGTYSFGRVKDLPEYTTAELAKRLRDFEDWWP